MYQIDGLVDRIIMLEAKDYAKRNKKVPLSALQKQEGALTDLSGITEGYFASATNYTKPAIQYTQSSGSNPMQKKITPFNIRKSNAEDTKGRIQRIAVQINALWPEFRPDSFRIQWKDQQNLDKFNAYLQSCGQLQVRIRLDKLYDDNSNQVITIEELIKSQQPKINKEDKEVDGEFVITANIKIENQLFKIKGIKYIADVIHLLNDFEVKKNGDAIMLAKCNDLGIDTLRTDDELQQALGRL